ncbi:sugar transferase [Burkholderia ubonensis]|uniref:sugar transferase n=1 Tax=Burkholderia ubonensis TaxID=101571 RepID=UPI0009B3E85E|nr:sugar transferase [Burkholderia ubonensis]
MPNLVASPLSVNALTCKAIFDHVFACVALLAIAPLMITIGVEVKLSSPGPVLFRQRHTGANGRVFTIYKLGTMRVHVCPEGGSVRQHAANRAARVSAALLRQTSLGELPQFFYSKRCNQCDRRNRSKGQAASRPLANNSRETESSATSGPVRAWQVARCGGRRTLLQMKR